MKSILRHSLAVLIVLLGLSVIHKANAQKDPRPILAGMISQLQTGTPNPMWYGVQLWQTIALQTGYTGVYPQLVQLGPVQNVVVTQQQPLPQGWLYAMTAQHSNGQSTWQIGISIMSNRIEYANFNVGWSPTPFPLPTNPAPSPSPGPSPTPEPDPSARNSEACRKFPNLC